MDYPEGWNQLPRHERRKKIKLLRRQNESKVQTFKKIRNFGLLFAAAIALIVGVRLLTRKSPEKVEFEQKVATVSLEGKVQEFPIEGRAHVSLGTPVTYNTNPPTSGDHFAEAESWGVNEKEVEDKAAVHGLEHGGIWISYKDIDEESIKILREIGRENSGSVIVSPRLANDAKIAVASWGRLMKLDAVDKALIQKYIATYKNQGPEKLAN
ncbi:MAG: hypothetical protein UY78_C0016G0003 [Parcubacteria group bacterium GW2011_GWA1_53_13]|nr:MAG: hypothetical protein UY78_C0016G0003 [Parcubacteria group bacterium GW2011_GWA1_53_13]